mgnify:CR=1 FL=1
MIQAELFLFTFFHVSGWFLCHPLQGETFPYAYANTTWRRKLEEKRTISSPGREGLSGPSDIDMFPGGETSPFRVQVVEDKENQSNESLGGQSVKPLKP